MLLFHMQVIYILHLSTMPQSHLAALSQDGETWGDGLGEFGDICPIFGYELPDGSSFGSKMSQAA
jgi:alpha-tubulin suppressor-like RCC1 family protein